MVCLTMRTFNLRTFVKLSHSLTKQPLPFKQRSRLALYGTMRSAGCLAGTGPRPSLCFSFNSSNNICCLCCLQTHRQSVSYNRCTALTFPLHRLRSFDNNLKVEVRLDKINSLGFKDVIL